jgi:hypothetical protein
MAKKSKKKWIQKAFPEKTKGALHKQMGVPMGEKIPASMMEAAAKAPGKKGMRARAAITVKKFGKKKGKAPKFQGK